MQKHGQKSFSPLVTTKDFFEQSGSVTFVPLGALASCKKLEKQMNCLLRYSKKGHGLTGQLTKDPFR